MHLSDCRGLVRASIVLACILAFSGVASAEDVEPDPRWAEGRIPDASRAAARSGPAAPVALIPDHQAITAYEGPATCVSCHETEAHEMFGSVHYQQAGPTPNVINIPGLAGERGPEDIGFNTYCGAHVTSRRSTWSASSRLRPRHPPRRPAPTPP